MKSLTAEKSLEFAKRAVLRPDAHSNTNRSKLVACILVTSLTVSLVAFVTLAFWQSLPIGAAKAITLIGILAVLLTTASTYSLLAICWNSYWHERSKRVDAESELRVVVTNLSRLVVTCVNTVTEDLADDDSTSTMGRTLKANSNISAVTLKEYASTVGKLIDEDVVLRAQAKLEDQIYEMV